jgi:hypothetical protein
MGYSENAAKCAVGATKNSSLEAVVEWLMANPDREAGVEIGKYCAALAWRAHPMP